MFYNFIDLRCKGCPSKLEIRRCRKIKHTKEIEKVYSLKYILEVLHFCTTKCYKNDLSENTDLLIHVMYLIRISLHMAIRCSSCKLCCCVCFVIIDELINILCTIPDGSGLNV